MFEGIYVAASGGFKQEKSLEVISNNLANVNTIGYKRDTLAFKELLAPFPGITESTPSASKPGEHNFKKDASYTGIAELKTDFSQGGIRETGNPLDVALDGEGFFTIQTKDGVRYTRQGNFRLSDKGVLITQNGNPVIGLIKQVAIEKPAPEELTVEEGSRENLPGNIAADEKGKEEIQEFDPVFGLEGPLTIKPSGLIISIDGEGTISVGNGKSNKSVGKLKIVKFDDPEKLIKTGKGLFMLTGKDVKEIAADNFSVIQGAIESSNVTAVKEMTKMIEVMRSYEAYQKVIQTIDSANERAATDLGRFG